MRSAGPMRRVCVSSQPGCARKSRGRSRAVRPDVGNGDDDGLGLSGVEEVVDVGHTAGDGWKCRAVIGCDTSPLALVPDVAAAQVHMRAPAPLELTYHG